MGEAAGGGRGAVMQWYRGQPDKSRSPHVLGYYPQPITSLLLFWGLLGVPINLVCYYYSHRNTKWAEEKQSHVPVCVCETEKVWKLPHTTYILCNCIYLNSGGDDEKVPPQKEIFYHLFSLGNRKHSWKLRVYNVYIVSLPLIGWRWVKWCVLLGFAAVWILM